MTAPGRRLSFWIVCILSVTVTLAYYLCLHHPASKVNSGIKFLSKGLFKINSLDNTTVNYDVIENQSRMREDQDRRNKAYLVVWYNLPIWGQGYLSTGVDWCPGVKCQVSSNSSLVDKADAVIVHAVDLPQSAKPRGSQNQFWVFFGMESPAHYHTATYRRSDWRGRFNWTMTYRLDSDIPAPYGKLRFFSDPHPINFTAIALNKTRPVAWFVSNCHPPSRRDLYVKQLQKYIDVDIYGKCGKQADTNGLLNHTYKFYLSFENSLCVDYVTEKLFKTYSAHIIPIVRGGSNYKHIPKGTYINTADFRSPEQLAKYLNFLDKNITKYSEILEGNHRYREVNMTNLFMCSLCRKLQTKPERKTYSDIHDWLTMSGKACHSPKDL